ncbi:MAG TPA: bifunctional (p)ppGpp synthetase/guanosine-3',5'-bis(diphosphate) 3'-pyrophosphohydrolase [Burkholderiales bacterium]|nr:bifunctional (p)ppGpp synthetase/guanosine-3',5'-bis(diphosphate) 3'-pyrophosphohydrolase [Burkholderiales bacterium]
MANSSSLKLVHPAQPGPASGGLGPLLERLSLEEQETVRRAYALVAPLYGERRLAGGEPALEHALGAAGIVADLKLDAEALAAALAAPLAGIAPARLPELKERCGAAVAEIVEGVARMAQIGLLSSRPQPASKPEQQAAQLEALRKMLLAMVQDVRVVLVKLADHTQELRYAVKSQDEQQRRAVAQLTGDVFAPLANRLGIWQLKWEMEDLAFRILDPATYQRIARALDEKRADRERYIEAVVAVLREELARAGIAAEVTGRPKHIFSIYRKMVRKGIDFESLYDIRAVRVLVQDVKDCYSVLGLVHHLWTPIPREFDDYIAKPKSNHYRSLHTAVIGPEGKALEVQIRTYEMHQHSELGIAAHWRYKEGTRHERDYDQKIAWLRQILEWKEEVGDAGELAERFRTGLFEDTIYVLTPQGKVIALPAGATPVDFAYHVHTELGHRCRGARVDGVMVPLNTPLANGQQVEILAAKEGGPSRDWLNPALGYARSHTARTKIRQWFNRQNLEAAVAQGRALVEKELQRQGLSALGLERVAARLGFDQVSDFLAEVGRGAIGPRQLQAAVRALDPRATQAQAALAAPAAPARRARAPARKASVLVVGVDRLLTLPAKCCKPVPPDAITGFITRGRGVTVHRSDCANLARLDPERLVSAEWGEAAGAAYPAEIEIEAADRTGLLRDISEVFARERINVTGTRSVSSEARAHMRFTLEVADLAQLTRVLALVREVRGVTRAVRR